MAGQFGMAAPEKLRISGFVRFLPDSHALAARALFKSKPMELVLAAPVILEFSLLSANPRLRFWKASPFEQAPLLLRSFASSKLATVQSTVSATRIGFNDNNQRSNHSFKNCHVATNFSPATRLHTGPHAKVTPRPGPCKEDHSTLPAIVVVAREVWPTVVVRVPRRRALVGWNGRRFSFIRVALD